MKRTNRYPERNTNIENNQADYMWPVDSCIKCVKRTVLFVKTFLFSLFSYPVTIGPHSELEPTETEQFVGSSEIKCAFAFHRQINN